MYRKLNGKIPIDKKLYSFEEVVDHVASGGQLGWLIGEGYVVIDVDDMDDSEKLLAMLMSDKKLKFKCYRTNNGMHFIFKRGKNRIQQGTNKHTPVSIQVDTRTSGKGYIVLPINDPNREIVHDPEFDDLSVIPKWLVPLNINTSNENFIKGVGEGGRNDALIRQVFRIKDSLVKPQVITKAINLINDFLFDEPLEAQELYKTVLREDVINMEVQMKEKKFSHVQLAEDILYNKEGEVRYNIQYIDKVFYMYSNGVFTPCEQDLLRIMVEMYPEIKNAQRNEVLSYLAIICYEEREVLPDHLVNVINGVYDLKAQKLLPHSPDIAGRNQMNFQFDDSKRVIEVDQFLLDVADGNEERRDLLLQMIGYSLTRSVREQKMFFLYGASANNGKSTFIKVLQELVGQSNYSTVSLKGMTERFGSASIIDKTLNVQADISGAFIKELEIIKNAVTGDEFNVERKGEDAFAIRPTAKFIFSANELPKAQKDSGWYRRLMIITFSRNFGKGGLFEEESVLHSDALDYLGTIALKAYNELYLQPANVDWKWANAEETEYNLTLYKEDTDSTLAFLNFVKIPLFKLHDIDGEPHIKKSEFFQMYKDFCLDNELKPKSNIALGKTFVAEGGEDKVFSNTHYWKITDKHIDETTKKKSPPKKTNKRPLAPKEEK